MFIESVDEAVDDHAIMRVLPASGDWLREREPDRIALTIFRACQLFMRLIYWFTAIVIRCRMQDLFV